MPVRSPPRLGPPLTGPWRALVPRYTISAVCTRPSRHSSAAHWQSAWRRRRPSDPPPFDPAFLLSWGNFPLSLFTTGADTTVPEYLYAKMVAAYTLGVPVLGTISTIGAIVILIGGSLVVLALDRRRRAGAN